MLRSNGKSQGNDDDYYWSARCAQYRMTRVLPPLLLRLSFSLLALSSGGSVAEWLACWTRAQKGPSSNRSCDAVG